MTTSEFLHLIHSGNLFELRALHADGSITSGLFNDAEMAEKYATHSQLEGSNVFYTLNPLSPKCGIGRRLNFMTHHSSATARDRDIERRTTYLIDVDPVRPSGLCSTDTELQAAHEAADYVKEYLRERGWPEPIVVCSGNGYHLIYKGDGCSSEGDVWRIALRYLASRFDTLSVKIDAAVFNAARIARLPGTLNRKGEYTIERPHRMASVISSPDQWESVQAGKIFQLAVLGGYRSPYDQDDAEALGTATELSEADVLRIVETFTPHLAVYKRTVVGDAIYFGLACCPMKGAEHKGQRVGGGKSALVLKDGRLGFSCFSDDCAHVTAGQLIRHLERLTGRVCPIALFTPADLDIDTFDGDVEWCHAVPYGRWDNADPEGLPVIEVLKMYREAVILELRCVPTRAVGERMIRQAEQVFKTRDVATAASYLGVERIASLRHYLGSRIVTKEEILKVLNARRVLQAA